VGVRVNDDIGHNFRTRKGLRQGDPLSPILFNIVADVLANLIARAKKRRTCWESHTSFSGWGCVNSSICR
jgi:retron-type reverse transcriptase